MSTRYAVRSLILVCLAAVSLAAFADNTKNPWAESQTVQAADLSKELANPKTAPTVIFVGFGRLYSAGHIKGAQYHGTAGNDDGLKQLHSWAESLPRGTNIVAYCGCCPMERCPNIRPAFAMLRDMGFTKARALILPSDFAKDWADKGYPYDKGQ
jgi:thiosulfate/3-mercaptopyruvate sulfurtransferase